MGNDKHEGRLIVPPVTPEQRRAVRLLVASGARDAEDCRQLLECLGLGEED